MPINPRVARQGMKALTKIAGTQSKIRRVKIRPGVLGLVDEILQTGGEGMAAFARIDQLLPEKIWRPIYKAQQGYNEAEAFYNKIFRDARKVKLKEGSEASEVFFDIFNTVERTKLIKNPHTAVPAELLYKLTPEQIRFIPVFGKMLDQLADLRGLPKEMKLAAYATWIRKDANKFKYVDMEEYLRQIQRPPGKRVFDPFAQKRKTTGEGIIKDFIKVSRVYTRYGLKKGLKEPVVLGLEKEVKKLSTWESVEFDEFMVDWLGKRRPTSPRIQAFLNRSVNLTYAGTLFANTSAAMVNLTQTLTATLPEFGALATLRGVGRSLTKTGIDDFMQSGVMADLMHGKRLRPVWKGGFDFFRQVEFTNRLFAYHTGKVSAEIAGKSGQAVVDAGFDAVRRTQFFLFGEAEAPKIVRRAGVLRPMLQFTQYPMGMVRLIVDWTKGGPKGWLKLARFGAITTALGGPQALLPTDGLIALALGDKTVSELDEIRKRYSISGLIGINLAPRFGLGMFPFLETKYGIPLPPVPQAGLYLTQLIGDVAQTIATEELDFDFSSNIIQSKFVQRALPTFVKGGVAVKKLMDIGNIPGGKYRYAEGARYLKGSGEKIATETTGERILRGTLGEPLRLGRIRELRQRTQAQMEIERKAKRKIVDKVVDGLMGRDTKKFNEGIQRLVDIGVVDPQSIKRLIVNEILRRSLDQQYNFLMGLAKKDRPEFLMELQKIERGMEE